HEASAYCVGQFDQLEYRRRRAWCDTEAGALDRLRAELVERRGRLDQEDRQRLDDVARLRTRYDAITTRLAALDSSLSGHIVSRLLLRAHSSWPSEISEFPNQGSDSFLAKCGKP